MINWTHIDEQLPPEQEEPLLFRTVYDEYFVGGVEHLSTDPGEFHFSAYPHGDPYFDKGHRMITHWAFITSPVTGRRL